MAGSRGTPLLIQCLQPRLHVALLCQSTKLFGIVWVLLSQAFAAGEVLILLRHCWRDAFFCVCVGSGSFCHDWASHCSVLFWSFDALFVFGLPLPSPLSHAPRRALCTLAGTWEQIRTKILRAFGGMMAGPLVATCLGTPSNSIIVSRVPVGQKKSQTPCQCD